MVDCETQERWDADPRPEMIQALADDVTNGMAERAVNATEDEVISAVFTVAMRMTKYVKSKGGDMSMVKDVLMRMLLECTDDKRLPS